MKKKRFGEFTCNCQAYNFPHRFGGGKCNGLFIVREKWETSYSFGSCKDCICCNKTEQYPYCEVLEGQEDIHNCPEFQDFIEYNEISWRQK